MRSDIIPIDIMLIGVIPSLAILSDISLSVVIQCHNARCHYVKCLYAECCRTKCRYSECHCAECVGILAVP